MTQQIRLADLTGEPRAPELVALDNSMDRILDTFTRQVAIQRERFYWQMIAHGWLPSMGWRMVERIEHKDGKMTCHLSAKPPKPQPRSPA